MAVSVRWRERVGCWSRVASMEKRSTEAQACEAHVTRGAWSSTMGSMARASA